MRLLIIPEDFRHDQYILRPLFERLVRSAGRRVRIEICRDPLLGGVTKALKVERLLEIVEQYQGMMDIFVLCVDRDGVLGRRQQLNAIEAQFGPQTVFLSENAWEEIETWVLAGLTLPAGWRWTDVRGEVQVKETYFEPLARERELYLAPGRGRKPLAAEAARNINAIRRKCDEFDCLATRLENVLADGLGLTP